MYLVFAAILLAFACSPRAQVYKWVDENGKVHFGDHQGMKKEGADEAEALSLPTHRSEWVPYDIQVNHPGVTLSDEEMQAIVDGTNAAYRFFDQILYVDLHKTVPVKINILSDYQAYNAYVTELSGHSAGRSLGMFLSRFNTIALYVNKERKRTLATVRHEVSHAVLYSISRYTPAWFNEGLAEQMETLKVNNEGLTISRHYGNYRAVQARGDSLKIDDFLDLNSHDWYRHSNASNFIHQAFAGELIYFFLSTSNGRQFVTRLLHEYKRGSRVRSRHLVDKHYIGNIRGMDAGWSAWRRSGGVPRIELVF